MPEQLTIIPQKWTEKYAPLPADFWQNHGLGLQRVWPDAPEVVTRVAREVGVAEALLVTRMEIEQSALSYAWDGSSRDYRDEKGNVAEASRACLAQGVVEAHSNPEVWKLYYLCGVDKTDGGPRKGGWCGPERQLYGCALRFKFWYRGHDGAIEVVDPMGDGLANHYMRPDPDWRNWLGLREDPAFDAGISVTRGGDTIVPANQASADCLRYTTSLAGSRRLSGLGKSWFPEDYDAPAKPEGGESMDKGILVCLDAGHPPGGGAHGVGGDEAALNLAIRNELTRLCQAAGWAVHLCQRTNSVGNIGRESAALRPDVFLSIHHNAGGGRGFEVYHAGVDYGGSADCAPNGRRLAQELARAVMGGLNLPAHGNAVRDRWYHNGKPSKLGVLSSGDNWAKSGAAALVEMAFVDSEADAKLLKTADYPQRAAAALFAGMAAYLGQPVTVPDPGTDVPTEGTLTEEDTMAWNLLVRATQQFLCDHGHTVVVDGWLGRETLGAAEDLQEALP